MTISGGQFGENHIQDFLHGCPINSVSVKQTQRGCFGQIITRSGLSNRFNKKISEAQVEKSKWYKAVGEEDYFSLAAQLIFLGDLVELVCSFTDLKIGIESFTPGFWVTVFWRWASLNPFTNIGFFDGDNNQVNTLVDHWIKVKYCK